MGKTHFLKFQVRQFETRSEFVAFSYIIFFMNQYTCRIQAYMNYRLNQALWFDLILPFKGRIICRLEADPTAHLKNIYYIFLFWSSAVTKTDNSFANSQYFESKFRNVKVFLCKVLKSPFFATRAGISHKSLRALCIHF